MQDFRQYFEAWSHNLESLRQNRLLDEGAFIRFANERSIDSWGVSTGAPGDFFKRGWLASDGTNYDGGPLFHPFRVFSLFMILKACRLNIAPSSTLRRDSMLGFIEKVMGTFPSVEQIGEMSRKWDRVIDLAILLEPVYWPNITGKITYHGLLKDDKFDAAMDEYYQKVKEMVASLNPAYWHKIHRQLRVESHRMDGNDDLYLLLRVSNWDKREKIKGQIGGALWLRHIAEVIRRAFEDVTDEKWPEEDEAVGSWFPGARLRVYGAERPIDDDLKSKSYLAMEFGLYTGSLVRWYVEGETEYFAIHHILLNPPKSGIEIINLRGNIETGKANIALKLRDCLKEDQALRRFSMISFDTDVAENVKAVKRQVDQKHIVGFIAAHKPDFEFANFTIQELTEIAAQLDEAHGVSGDVIRKADWTGVSNGRAFEERYKTVSTRKPRSLKGEEWGKALAEYVATHPNRSDNGEQRPFWHEISSALRARTANYDYQKNHYSFDSMTFEIINI